MAIEIREAITDDVDAIATVHVGAWREAFTFLPDWFLLALTIERSRAKWETDLSDGSAAMFVGIVQSGVIGFLQVHPAASEIMSLYVKPEVWNRGCGTDLLAFGERWLKGHGSARAVLRTARDSQQSRDFYERRAWRLTGEEQVQTLAPGVDLFEVQYERAL